MSVTDKIANLKAAVQPDTISPITLATILEELLALQTQRADDSQAVSDEALSLVTEAITRAQATIEASEQAVHAAQVTEGNMNTLTNDLRIAKSNAETARMETHALQVADEAFESRLSQAEQNINILDDDINAEANSRKGADEVMADQIDGLATRMSGIAYLGAGSESAAFTEAAKSKYAGNPKLSVLTYGGSTSGHGGHSDCIFQYVTPHTTGGYSTAQWRLDQSTGAIMRRVVTISATGEIAVGEWTPFGATQVAIDTLSAKVDTKADTDHTHPDLAAANHTHADLASANHTHADLAAKTHTHAASEIQGLQEYLFSYDGALETIDQRIQLAIGENMLAYGVERDLDDPDPAWRRIGNEELHRTLPIQSGFRGCLMADDGAINEYLPADSWLESTRDGSAGQVLVEIPAHFRCFRTIGNKIQVWLSQFHLEGFHFVDKCYPGSSEASIQRSTGKLCSVVNSDPDYRGGDNAASYDTNEQYTLLGRPVTSMTRTAFRTAARKRGNGSHWNQYTYGVHKTMLWCYVVEYANNNIQLPYNPELTEDGFRQGGLGNGVTIGTNTTSTTAAYNTWTNANGRRPFVPCGYTDEFGNGSGVKAITNSMGTFYVPRYRGIENPFGHIWKWTDGVNTKSPVAGQTEMWVCYDPSKFNDSNYTGYTSLGLKDTSNEKYVTRIMFGEGGDIFATAASGSSTTYFCDTTHDTVASTALRALLLGGGALNGSFCGLFYAFTSNAPSYSNPIIGSRLCYIP